MARIYKESRYVLQLLIGKSYGAQYEDVKISFYTKNPNNQVMADNDITIKGNVAEVMVDSTLFDNLEEGLIKYIVYGTKDGIPFIEERQSNYFLKTPLDFKPTTCILEDKSVTPSMSDRDGNNLIVVEESEGYDGLSRVVINPQTIYNEGVEAGRAEGGQGGSCNLGIGEFGFDSNTVGDYELNASDDGYDGWSKMFIHIYGDGGAIRVQRASDLLDSFNNDNGAGLDYGWNYYVGGIITEKQEFNTEYDYATYILDNGFKIYRGKWLNGDSFLGEDPIKLGAYAIVYGVLQDNNGELGLEEGSQMVAYQECGGGSCNLEDKSVTPSMSDRDGNNLIVVEESVGYDGLSRVVIDPQTIYNEGVDAGRAEGGEGGSCNLISRTFTSNGVYRPEAEQMQTIWFTADKPSAYDTGIKLVDDSWVEIYFSATEGGDTPTLIGREESDWNETTFATRWYGEHLNVKIGNGDIDIPYTPGDGKLHKLKFGKTVGVWFDDVKVSGIEGQDWVPTDRTIYIGAMNDPSNNNENGFWRPWVGYIGDVTVYGSLNENVGEYHFKAGDYGRWGEFKRVEDDTNLPNLGGDGMAIAQAGSYGEAPDGFSEVTVNVPQYNLGTLDWTLTEPNGQQKNASDDGYDGYSAVVVRPENIIAQEKENAINDFKNKMREITITKNGTFSIDDQETRQYVEFDGNSYFDTGIVPTENAKIEVAITKTTYEEDEQFIGCAHYDLINEASTYGGFGLVVGAGLTYGCFGKAKTNNITFSIEEEQILTLDRTGLESSLYGRVGWIDDSADFNYVPGRTIAIGKINSSDGWMYRGLNGRIRYVKIWTNKDDDSTMTLFRPKNMAQGGFGMVNSEGTEYRYVENLGSGTATFVEENVNKYPYGFKRVEVNVPTDNVPEYPYSYIPTNTIYYKTADGQLSEKIGLDLNGRPSGFGLGINGEVLNIVSNTYEDGVGKIVFDGEVYKVGPVMYSNLTETGDVVIKLENIVEIQLPSSITSVENGAFSQTGLREIILPPNITQIDTYALKNMQYLYRIVFYSDEPNILQNNVITLSQTTFGKILHNKAYGYSNMKSNIYYKQKGWTFETF